MNEKIQKLESNVQHHLRDLYYGIRNRNKQIAEYSLDDLMEIVYKLKPPMSDIIMDKYHGDIIKASRAVKSMRMPSSNTKFAIVKYPTEEVIRDLVKHHIEDAHEAEFQAAFDMADFSLEDAKEIASRAPTKKLFMNLMQKIANAQAKIIAGRHGLFELK